MNVAIPFTFIEACAGVGTLGLGFKLAIEHHFGRPAVCLANIEREASAATALLARCEEESLVPAPIWCGDIESFPCESFVGRVDGIVAGIPCPDFSMAGNRAGTDGERWLWPALWDLASRLRVDWIAVENVFGFISGGGLIAITDQLAKSGWSAEWLHLRASEVGASHERERIFILAHSRLGKARGCAERSDAGCSCEQLGDAAGDRLEVRRAIHGRYDREGSDKGRNEIHPNVADSEEHGRRQGRSESEGIVGGLDAPERNGEVDNSTGSRRNGAGERTAADIESRECLFGEGCADVADTGSGQLQEPGRGSQGRDGSGPAGEALGDPERQRLPESRPRLEQPVRSVANTEHGERRGDGNASEERSEIGAPTTRGSSELANTNGGRRRAQDDCSERVQQSDYESLPLFAPGPNDPRWLAIIDQFPWLAPALPKMAMRKAGDPVDRGGEASAQSHFHMLANGYASSILDQSRADALRASGNSCSFEQSAMAFAELLRRIED